MGIEINARRLFASTGASARYGVGLAAAIAGKDAEPFDLLMPLLDENAGSMKLERAEFAYVLREIASCCYRLGRFRECEGICQRALGECGVNRRTGRLIALLAMARQAQGNLTEATRLLLNAEKLQRRATGRKSVEYKELCGELAEIFLSCNHYHNAVQCLRRCRLPIECRWLTDRAALLTVLDRQCLVAKQWGRHRLVEALLRRQLSLIRGRRRWIEQEFRIWIQLVEARSASGLIDSAREALSTAEQVYASRRRALRSSVPLLEHARQLVGSPPTVGTIAPIL